MSSYSKLTMLQSLMRINEIFYSIQGEGKSAGTPILFIRLSGCNLKCSFCDTPYHPEGHDLGLNERILLTDYKKWCITGGEPLLQQNDILTLIRQFRPSHVEIETNGTVIPNESLVGLVNQFNVSPKEKRFQPEQCDPTPHLLEDMPASKAIVKFVYEGGESENFIFDTIRKYKIPKNIVWIMPEGKTQEEIDRKQKKVWKFCADNGFNFSPRLHVLVHGDKRGV